MLYVGKTSIHTKQRGQIRQCAWCGQAINIGEQYAKFLCFDGGSRQTVYAHWKRPADDMNLVSYPYKTGSINETIGLFRYPCCRSLKGLKKEKKYEGDYIE